MMTRERLYTVTCTADGCEWSEKHAIREVVETLLVEHYRSAHPLDAEQVIKTLRQELGSEL